MKKTCGAKFIYSRGKDSVLDQLRDEHGLFRLRCDLEPGHEGNHHAKTKFAEMQWWNEEKNPQRGMKL